MKPRVSWLPAHSWFAHAPLQFLQNLHHSTTSSMPYWKKRACTEALVHEVASDTVTSSPTPNSQAMYQEHSVDIKQTNHR